MRFIADLHVHSHLSRATSKQLDLEHLHRAAQVKGITVVATGDFTHPRWFRELSEKLVPAEPGLFALRDDLASPIDEQVPRACRSKVRFVLSVEISSIYKQAGRVRKVHNLVYVPDLECAARISSKLATIGNIEADGRPILGLESRNLLEIVLASSPDAFLVPAHVWTPWFSALGAQSGFDSIDECFGDLSNHIFALETGLSSDPAMNWRLSQLDRFTLISNSDAHSPDKLGREANVFDCELSYFALRDALRSSARDGFVGTLEFFPEEGKYHFDGHRACGVVVSPREALALQGVCPRCAKRLTAGVASRVEQLADRAPGFRPLTSKPFSSLIPLPELIGELVDARPTSEKVRRAYAQALERSGPELRLLTEAHTDELDRIGVPLLSEAVARMRRGQVDAQAGFDGEYGTIRVFASDERRRLLAQQTFGFALATTSRALAPRLPLPQRDEAETSVIASPSLCPPAQDPSEPVASAGLNPEQVLAVQHLEGPLLIIAGPGTGKTRTLTHRIAHVIAQGSCPLSAILAITFTRKAADELRQRLGDLLGTDPQALQAMTFHAFGLDLLRRWPGCAGLPNEFQVWGELDRLRAIETCLAQAPAPIRVAKARVAQFISWEKAHLRGPGDGNPDLAPAFQAYEEYLAREGAVDFDDLIVRAVRMLEANPEALELTRARCRHLLVDEYQDINLAQYRLVRLLAPSEQRPNLCAVGDPDQAIYGFRGANPSYFESFAQDYPGARVLALSRNYRSAAAVVRASTAVIEGAAGRTPRPLEPLTTDSPPVEWIRTASDIEEAEVVLAEIERALGGTSLYSYDSGRAEGQQQQSLALHDIAILFRTAAQSKVIEDALARAGIPFSTRGGDAISARPAVAELLAELAERLPTIESRPAADSIVARPPADPIESGVECSQVVVGGAEPRPRTVRDLVLDVSRARSPDDPARARAADLLATLAVPFANDLPRFLDAVPTMHECDAHLQRQKVALLTMHAAKGLEFSLVFLVGCEDGLIPLELPGLENADAEEERRILYVGMTRAKERLVLTSAGRRSLFGRALQNGPSRFLHCVPDRWLSCRTTPARPRRARQLSLF